MSEMFWQIQKCKNDDEKMHSGEFDVEMLNFRRSENERILRVEVKFGPRSKFFAMTFAESVRDRFKIDLESS